MGSAEYCIYTGEIICALEDPINQRVLVDDKWARFLIFQELYVTQDEDSHKFVVNKTK